MTKPGAHWVRSKIYQPTWFLGKLSCTSPNSLPHTPLAVRFLIFSNFLIVSRLFWFELSIDEVAILNCNFTKGSIYHCALLTPALFPIYKSNSILCNLKALRGWRRSYSRRTRFYEWASKSLINCRIKLWNVFIFRGTAKATHVFK